MCPFNTWAADSTEGFGGCLPELDAHKLLVDSGVLKFIGHLFSSFQTVLPDQRSTGEVDDAGAIGRYPLSHLRCGRSGKTHTTRCLIDDWLV